MAIHIPRGPSPDEDDKLRRIVHQLEQYARDHPASDIALYRHSPYIVRIRIVDDGFGTMTRAERHRQVWTYLEGGDEESLSDIGSLILLTESEQAKSPLNMEFEDPIPSRF